MVGCFWPLADNQISLSRGFLRPVLVIAVVQPGRMAAFHPKAAIELETTSTTATDPKRTFETAYLDLRLPVGLAATK